MMMFLKSILLALLALWISGCSQAHKRSNTLQSYIVKAQTLHKVLHFSGTIAPIKESTVVSPLDAVVETMNVHYGQRVKKGEVLLTLTSSELQKQYNDTLTEYLKAKDSYSIAQAKFVGTQDLWHSGLLSKNNYLSEQSALATARITLMQQTRKLTALLENMDEEGGLNLSALSLSDFSKIKTALTAAHNVIHLKAANDGVMLYPPKSGDDKATRIGVGSSIKAGQVIALIGDLSGVGVEIEVPEVDIDKIHAGMRARVSGIAFGAHHLEGHLIGVNAQASNTSGGSLPSFNALVEVKKLKSAEQALIKVGMSATIELQVDNHKQLIIPIAALTRKRGATQVQVKTASGAVETRVITTGAALADSVVVETGLKEGDVVLYE